MDKELGTEVIPVIKMFIATPNHKGTSNETDIVPMNTFSPIPFSESQDRLQPTSPDISSTHYSFFEIDMTSDIHICNNYDDFVIFQQHKSDVQLYDGTILTSYGFGTVVTYPNPSASAIILGPVYYIPTYVVNTISLPALQVCNTEYDISIDSDDSLLFIDIIDGKSYNISTFLHNHL